MHRVVYISSAPVPWSPEDLADLLAVSRRNNAAAGITGMLLYHEQSFLQVLEGEEPALSACFDRIARDPRHRNLIVMWRGAAAERIFANWQMGFARMCDLVADGAISLEELFRRGLEGPGDPVVEKLVRVYLRGFPDIAGPSAARL